MPKRQLTFTPIGERSIITPELASVNLLLGGNLSLLPYEKLAQLMDALEVEMVNRMADMVGAATEG